MKKTKHNENKQHVVKLPISKFIDTKFRDYSIYVLEARGIPSFFDGLTPVQRYILMNSPTSFQKTLTVVGKSIDAGYHHGDFSIIKAISKLARPFGSGLQILDGYGFFGSEVCPEPAAARYTSLKISTPANNILNKYKHLTKKEPEGAYQPFWMDVPLGLTLPIVGIAVGYKTTILPRKLCDIQAYLEGKVKSLKPYFIGFSGSIKEYRGAKNSWLISSDFNVVGNRIEVKGISPVLRYSSVLKKLDWLFNKFESNVRILNNSNTNVIIDVVYLGKKQEEWKEIQDFVRKTFSVIVTEGPVFIKDEQVLVYDSVEQYLDDYKWQVKRLLYNQHTYEKDFLTKELEFNIAKEKFIGFILLKKRTVKEIDVFLKLHAEDTRDRLERLTSKKFTEDELLSTKEKITELKDELKIKDKELTVSKKEFEKMKDPTLKRGITSKRVNTNLFDVNDISEIDGICVWDGEDVGEDPEKIKKTLDDEE